MERSNFCGGIYRYAGGMTPILVALTHTPPCQKTMSCDESAYMHTITPTLLHSFMNLRLNATAPANTLFGLSVSIDGRGNSAAVSDAMNKVDTYFWAPGEFP
jgi:hypothetical protein